MADGSIFNLTAQADRIERRTDGSLVVIDYKSGRVPSPKEINAGFAPQLTLEAAMLERNAFEDIPAGTVADAVYVKLGGDDGIDEKSIVGRGKTLKELVDEQFGGLRVLIEQFRDAQTAYVSRPFPQFVSRYGVYDHLARVKEWSSTIEES
jgi:ATP-dependent helicase/nuclease subunit B